MLSDTHPRVRYEACQDLAGFVPMLSLEKETENLIVETLLRLVDNQEMMVKIASVEALTALRSFNLSATKVIPVFQNLLNHTDNPDLKGALQKALSVLKND